MNGQGELPLGELQADYGWFHVMRPRLMEGLIGQIGETAWAVYTIIKAHANHHTGRSWPSQESIGALIGKTPETVGRATRVLAAHDLLVEHKRGRSKEYQLLESAPLTSRLSGSAAGAAEFAYVPREFANQLAALKSFLQDGVPPGRGLTLNLTVNLVQQRDNGTVNLQTVNLSPDLAARDDMRDLVQRLKRLNG